MFEIGVDIGGTNIKYGLVNDKAGDCACQNVSC